MAKQHLFIIQGDAQLQGELCVDGNKNAALPLIAAPVLFPQDKVVLNAFPQILDVKRMRYSPVQR